MAEKQITIDQLKVGDKIIGRISGKKNGETIQIDFRGHPIDKFQLSLVKTMEEVQPITIEETEKKSPPRIETEFLSKIYERVKKFIFALEKSLVL